MGVEPRGRRPAVDGGKVGGAANHKSVPDVFKRHGVAVKKMVRAALDSEQE